MSLFWTIILFSFAFGVESLEPKHHKKVPSAVIVGTVYCDTCFQQNFHKASHFIQGASVAVECNTKGSAPHFRQEAKTDNHGQFKVRLPFSVSKSLNKIKGCSVKLISSNQPYCAVAADATSSTVHLKSRKHGTHIFSAGFFTFKPLKQPEACNQKPVTNNNVNKVLNSLNDPALPPPVQYPAPPVQYLAPPSDPPASGRFLPPLPQLPNLPPLPQLPRLPPLPGIPFLPPQPEKESAAKGSQKESAAKGSQLSDSTVRQPKGFIFPPNPLLPPPSLLPANPFQPPPSVIPPVFPSPPASIFPPLFPSPSSPPFFRLPPFPGLTPSPTPPLAFPIPLPPFPFQPTPGFPGVPPAEVSSSSKTSSP